MTAKNCTSKSRITQPTIKAGDVFSTTRGGDVTVIAYENKANILVRFNDEHAYEVNVESGNLRKGSIRNPYAPTHCGVGYIGVGKYWFKRDKVETSAYKKWTCMLTRCYSELELVKYPTYRECSVHSDWHNFQKFAEWYYSQEHCDTDYQLDKDLLIDGNKIYSADTCTLLPAIINTLLLDCEASRGDLPVGVSFNKQYGKYSSGIRIDGVRHHLGYFDNIPDAAKAYQKAKKHRIRTKTLEWEGMIDKRIFDKLTR